MSSLYDVVGIPNWDYSYTYITIVATQIPYDAGVALSQTLAGNHLPPEVEQRRTP